MPPNETPHRAFSMADVSAKPSTRRRALACGEIRVGAKAFELLNSGTLPKGDALAMAEIAGIQGAKSTPQLLPLCHPISLSKAAIYTVLDDVSESVRVFSLAEITERTGVEMEALTGVSVALLTIWDLTKPVNAALEISGLRLLYKSGGKSGDWVHPNGLDDTAREILGLESGAA